MSASSQSALFDPVQDCLENLAEVWGNPKSFVWEKFYPENAQYNDGDSTNFEKWYYASFTLLDEEANKWNEEFEKQVQEERLTDQELERIRSTIRHL